MASKSELLLATDLPSPEDAHYWLIFNARVSRLAVGSDRADHVYVFDPRTGREIARLSNLPKLGRIRFLAGDRLLVLYENGLLACDLRTGKRETIWVEEGDYVCDVGVSPNGRVAAIGLNRQLLLIDVAKKKELRRLTTLYGYGGPSDPLFSEGGRYVAAYLSEDNRGPHIIAVWDAVTGRRQRTFETGQCAKPLAFLGDTLTLAVENYYVELYEADQGEDPVATFQIQWPNALQFRNRGRTVDVLVDDGSRVCFDRKTGKELRRLTPPASELRYARASVDWSLFAAAAKGGIVVW